MKRSFLLFALATVVLCLAACKKTIYASNDYSKQLYNKWLVHTIKVNSILFPRGIVWDTVYNAKATDYIDLSKKGTIDFYINQQHELATYDTTKYDLLKDTSVAIGTGLGFNSISLKSITNGAASLEHSQYGIDAGSQTIYTLVK